MLATGRCFIISQMGPQSHKASGSVSSVSHMAVMTVILD